jgi:hypothetical protein
MLRLCETFHKTASPRFSPPVRPTPATGRH